MFPFRDNIPASRFPLVTFALIALNAAMLLLVARMPEERRDLFIFQHGFIPARIGQLVTHKPLEVAIPQEVELVQGVVVARVEKKVVLPPDEPAIIASLFSSMFLHGGLMHLLGNMWFLWLFGDNVEDRLGHVPYLLFYLLGGLAAALCHWINDPHAAVPVVGASGAVAAVLGAYAVTWPHARIRTLVVLVVFVTVVELPALLFLGGWFVMQILSGLQPQQLGLEGGVAWWAHVGGFAAGAILMPLMRGPDPATVAHDYESFSQGGPPRRMFGE